MTRFSIRDLLIFFVAIGAFLSSILFMYRQFQMDPSAPPSVGTLVVSWILLFGIYAYWRLYGVLFCVHCLGPLGALLIVAAVASGEAHHSWSDGAGWIRTAELGCFVGTFVSFPIATLLMCSRRFEAPREGSRKAS